MVSRKPVPTDAARELVEATQALAAADERWRQAIVDALRAGGSYREVAPLSGASHGTIEKVARERGWPDAAELKRREEYMDDRNTWKRATEWIPPAPYNERLP